jgi:hypothetical protein
VAQSIGGGGGGGAVFTDASTPSVSFSLDNVGNGGNITYHQVGDIAAAGKQSYGPLAQSIGGGGGFVDGAFAVPQAGARIEVVTRDTEGRCRRRVVGMRRSAKQLPAVTGGTERRTCHLSRLMRISESSGGAGAHEGRSETHSCCSHIHVLKVCGGRGEFGSTSSAQTLASIPRHSSADSCADSHAHRLFSRRATSDASMRPLGEVLALPGSMATASGRPRQKKAYFWP